jgi:hypothetical protein
MAFNEIAKAIQWSGQSTKQEAYPVIAYLVLHNGVASAEPVAAVRSDAVWYVHGVVWKVDTPTPHLAGVLDHLYGTNHVGEMVQSDKITVSVQIFPNGKLTILRLINGNPIGGLPPTQLQASDVQDNLMVAIDGTEVWTLGVARVPHSPIGPA